MKALLTISILAIGLTAATWVTGTWTLDKENVKINWALGDKTGTFNGLEAEIHFDPAFPANAKIRAVIDVTSQHTGIKDLDNHLQTVDFFEADKYPVIVFESTSVGVGDSGFVAKGMLTVKDTTIEVEIPFTFEQTDAGGLFSGTLALNTGQLHVSKPTGVSEPNCRVTIEVPVVKE